MRLDNESESDNVEDRRGSGGGGFGGRATVGIGTIVVALAASYFFGIDPRVILQGAQVLQGQSQQTQQAPRAPVNESPQEKASYTFTRKVLGNIERTWTTVFPAQLNRQYVAPKLVVFSGATQTACGTGQTAMGPFYCPGDSKVYIDLAFYDELKQRFGAGGDFAQAYVIAHEVGHHVQNLLGISDQFDKARRRLSEGQANALSVRLELQADCFAGVWANNAAKANQQLFEPGDIEQGLKAASAIGDDRLQKQAQGYVVPESFTHGTSAQRVYWLRQGLQYGDVRKCDTFAAKTLS